MIVLHRFFLCVSKFPHIPLTMLRLFLIETGFIILYGNGFFKCFLLFYFRICLVIQINHIEIKKQAHCFVNLFVFRKCTALFIIRFSSNIYPLPSALPAGPASILFRNRASGHAHAAAPPRRRCRGFFVPQSCHRKCDARRRTGCFL